MPRILHIMLKVTDLDKSVDFYTNVLGMRVLELEIVQTELLHLLAMKMSQRLLAWSWFIFMMLR